MLEIIATVAVVIAVLIAAVLAYAATRPDTFRVQRTTSIKAPPDRIFALINDFRAWESWSPYEKRDPALKRFRGGAIIGKGSVYEWDGNNQVGKGRMEIVESTAPSRIRIKLDFFKPFKAHNTAEFTIDPQGGETSHVTWAMYGPSSLMAKVVGLFVNCDRMVGKDFETGLANLKAIAEGQTEQAAA